MDIDEVRDAIVLATLPHVAFDGWSGKALAAGAADAGYPPEVAARAFPEGITEAIGHWSALGDRTMTEAMAALDLEGMRIRDRIAAGVRLRIGIDAAHREAVRRTLSFLALPPNAPLAVANTLRTVSALWYAAGDRSTDFDFYTKRAMLVPVYASTVLYWLNDRSEDQADTWAFLDRRIDEALAIPKLRARIAEAAGRLLPPLARRRRGLWRRPA
ncbi:MAG: COQ9 family protein [Rhodospirillales bacterium]